MVGNALGMKTKNTAWTAEEDSALERAVQDKISPARLSVRLRRSEGSIKRRMRELNLVGKRRGLCEMATSAIQVRIDPMVQARRWLDACKSGKIAMVMDFYSAEATLECGCKGASVYAGAGAIQEYWFNKLQSLHPEAFALRDMRTESDRVRIDYLSFEGKPVRMLLSFDEMGKVIRSECGPVDCGAMAA
jgi:hypothetical protein